MRLGIAKAVVVGFDLGRPLHAGIVLDTFGRLR